MTYSAAGATLRGSALLETDRTSRFASSSIDRLDRSCGWASADAAAGVINASWARAEVGSAVPNAKTPTTRCDRITTMPAEAPDEERASPLRCRIQSLLNATADDLVATAVREGSGVLLALF